jgi:hypothetical protein
MRTERLRIAQRGFDREMILERDLSLHVFSRKQSDALDKARSRLCADLKALASIDHACRALRSQPLEFKLWP